MAEYGDISPVHSPWPTTPIGDSSRRRHPGEENEDNKGRKETDEGGHDREDEQPVRPPGPPPDDGLPHVDEFA